MLQMVLPKLKRKHNHRNVKRFDVDKLTNRNYGAIFENQIGGRFTPLLNFDGDIDELYEKFKSTTNEVTNEVVGKRNRKAVDGMSRETALLCD